VRGVAVSFEMILVIAGVLILAMLGAYAYGKSLVAYSSSEKATASMNDARVWLYLEPYYSLLYAKRVVVNVYITNLGSEAITVNTVKVEIPPERPGFTWKTIELEVPREYSIVNPGETRMLSVTGELDLLFARTSDGEIQYYYYSPRVTVTVQYTLVSESGAERTMEVSKPVVAELVISG